MTCSCGDMIGEQLSARSVEIVIDALLAETVQRDLAYVPQPTAPYSLVMSSNPYKQLLYEGNSNLPN